MSLHDIYLERALGSPAMAAAKLAKDLTIGDPSRFKVGYTIPNAILAAQDVFPGVPESSIRRLNNWKEEA